MIYLSQVVLGVGTARATSEVTLQVPWRTENIPDGKTVGIVCMLYDPQCKIIQRKVKSIRKNMNRKNLQEETFVFNGDNVDMAVMAQCVISREDTSQGMVFGEKKVLPGKEACQKTKRKTRLHDVKSGDKGQGDGLIMGKTHKEWEKVWTYYADTSEAAAKEGRYGKLLVLGSPWVQRRKPPEYCEKDKHCRYGHYWSNIFGRHWEDEFKGACVNHKCVDDVSSFSTDGDTNGNVCKKDYECSNKNYAGYCKKKGKSGRCLSMKRGVCSANPKAWLPCFTIDGKLGKGRCLENGMMGTCREI
ncbi:MAG: hypothetical protein D6698_00120 [Gammaproteobacteria bacterium]|nr:MAG: hypothetical protein D6698_00120 [Gammaproteobacteria bacterium]